MLEEISQVFHLPYLHILGNKNKIQMFKQMISEKDIETIEKYEKTIQELIVELHNLYLKDM